MYGLLNGQAVAAGASVGLERWQQGLGELVARVGPRFARVEPRRRVVGFLRGLLAGLPRPTCWSIAEHAGEAGPQGMQRLLRTASWDTDGVAEDLRAYVVEHLGGPDGVLVIDETGDVKKGTATVGVQRQYSGTAGRVENCQVAVYLAYTRLTSTDTGARTGGPGWPRPAGYAFIGRRLYLPQVWTRDQARCTSAGVPEDVAFATKPALARQLITDTLAAGTPAAWVTADEVYGADPTLRAAIAAHGLGFVLAVAKNHPIHTGIGPRRAIDLAVRLPADAWQTMSAGPGAKGHRLYNWALIETTDPALKPPTSEDTTAASTGEHVDGEDGGGGDWLLIRRSLTTGEYAFYRAHTTRPTPLATLVRVAGSRWRIEDAFASSKQLTGLDEHQVRTWTAWHRWTLLAMLAHAFLSIMATTDPTTSNPKPDPGTASTGGHSSPRPRKAPLIALTRHEIRRLLITLTTRAHPPEHYLHWSRWRRHHQHQARQAHYRRRAAANDQ